MEYKFRGKRIPDNKWIYGSLMQWPNGECEIVEMSNDNKGVKFMTRPETVGMWTGLKDKNGLDIYEGDIIEFVGGTTHYLSCGNYAYDDYGIGQILVVRYLKSGFTLSSSDILKCDAPNVVGNVKQYDFWNHQNSLKIIGNIHEHPHLLNPAQGAVINTMNNFDPNEQKQQEEQLQATEQEAQEKAMESAEEGGSEG